jgi:group I intron endonuclease
MKEYKGKSGIYKITCKINNKVYVGKTKDFYKRYHQYLSDFRRVLRNESSRLNCYFENIVRKHGLDSFNFEVLEFCAVEELKEREFYWMLKLESLNPEIGFNLRFDSDSVSGVSESTREKIRKRVKTEWENGVRSGHSQKLKESWKTRDRINQGRMFSEILTKHVYLFESDTEFEIFKYRELYDKIGNSFMSSFHRLGSTEDVVTIVCNGNLITRIKL